ncbi:hypothetical protein M1M07_28435 [Rhodococcus sp. HM1]|uniref:hypothetical protein n=1 Tax=Rhodococcus sp. HM1 TaxID=2937759 RepID=UPI00200A4CD5|nr:hypothetical protein [Rhodococcus sp. HM1]MCK8675023.1 hypothetical protein [Rhodococcus sp. HM1]
MTVLTANVRDIAGADDATVFTFETPAVRGGLDGSVVTIRARRYTAEYGVLTTDDLEPGPAVLHLSGGMRADYRITIPDSTTPVQLWPLIDAATPPDNEAWMTGFVRNGGGVARVAAMVDDEYWLLVADGLDDPATVYFTVESL